MAERFRAYLIVLLLTLGIGGASLSGPGLSLPSAAAFFATPEPAPDFTLDLVDGDTFRLSDHRGEVVVIDLMAVECPSCRITEKGLLEAHTARPDAVMISVDIWTEFEDEAYMHRHMERLGADWAYGMDTDRLLFKYGAYEISKVVVVDKEGYVAWSRTGGIDGPSLIAAIDAAADGTAKPQRTLGLGLIGFAAFAGVAAFFAPCAFPLLPGYMAYTLSLGGRGDGPSGRPRTRVRDAIAPGLFAAGGILIVYGLFGLVVAAFGEAAAPILPYLQPVVGVAAIGFGIALLLGASMDRIIGPLQRTIDRARRRLAGDRSEGTWVGYLSYGIGYGAAAAGCVAPVFLQLTLTAIALGALTGLKVFAIYGGVAAVLMVLATIIAVKARTLVQSQAARVVRIVNRASGAVLVAAGIYLVWYFNRGFGTWPGLG